MFEQEIISLGALLQLVDGPVLVVPAQEPAGEGWQFKPLFDCHDGSSGVSVGRVALNVPDSWTQTSLPDCS